MRKFRKRTNRFLENTTKPVGQEKKPSETKVSTTRRESTRKGRDTPNEPLKEVSRDVMGVGEWIGNVSEFVLQIQSALMRTGHKVALGLAK